MNEELLDCDSVNEMLKVLNKYYDLDNCFPTSMIKSVLLPQLIGAVEQLDPEGDDREALQEASKQKSIVEIFSTIDDYFDLDISLSPIQKQKIIAKLSSMLSMVGAKQRRKNA